MPRGSDFEARWREGAWAEQLVISAVNQEQDLLAVQYGITDGTAFWSSAEMAARELPDQGRHGKRPDVLVFARDDLSPSELGQVASLLLVSDEEAEALARKARFAIECEFSPYAYRHRLENYGKELSFTIKEEDLGPLERWEDHLGVPLGIVQTYCDSSFLLPFRVLRDGIANGSIRRQIERAYQKAVYYPPMSTGVEFGSFSELPVASSELILDRYGKYTPVRVLTGGKLALTEAAGPVLRGA